MDRKRVSEDSLVENVLLAKLKYFKEKLLSGKQLSIWDEKHFKNYKTSWKRLHFRPLK